MGERTAAQRFWEKVDASGGPTACWPWTGSRRHHGYGQFWDGQRLTTATKWLLGHLRGAPLRWDAEVRELACHACDNPPCVNPAHLYVGSHKSNTADMVSRGRHGSAARAAAITRCQNGHDYNDENTYVRPNGKRSCRICQRQRQRRGLRTIRIYP